MDQLREALEQAIDYQPLGIPVFAWVIWLTLTIIIWFFLTIITGWIRRSAEQNQHQTDHKYDDYIARVMKRTSALGLFAVSAYLSLLVVDLTERVEHPLSIAFRIVIFFQAGWWALALVDVAVQRGFRYANFTDAGAQTAFGVAHFFAKILVWSIVILLVLNVLGIEITPLLAGLGIGGIAVAFALQNILKDIFNSVAIVMDRPFEVGDFIIVGDFMGTVEMIGIKTTRLRSLGGEQLIIANSDLVSSRIRNYKRMQRRRVVFGLGLNYNTPVERLEALPDAIREIVSSQENVEFDRAHFFKFGDSALEFEVVYYVLSADYNLYMDIQQRINFALVRRFQEFGVSVPFPSRTLYLEPSSMPLRTDVRIAQPSEE